MSLKMIIFIIVLLIIGALAYFNYTQTSRYHGAVSDHFNGTVFVNAQPYHQHNFIDVMRWALTASRAKWPSYIENHSAPELTPATQEQIKATWVNHATMLVQAANFNFLTDPIWTERASPVSFIGPKRVRAPGVAFKNLPRIDAVFVSHNHYDHLSLPTLKRLSDQFNPVIFVPLGLKSLLERHGIQNVIEMDWWQTHKVKEAVITFLPTKHWSQRGVGDRYKTLWGSYGIAVGNKKIYFAGDAGYSPYFKTIQQQWGKPDLAFLPIGSYLPEWFMKENHMNPAEALQAHHDLQASHSIGIHFGTFQLSDEAIDQPLIDLQAAKAKQQVADDAFVALDIGQTKVY